MATSKKLKDGSYIDATGVYDTTQGKTQQAVNDSKFDKAGGTITGDVVFQGALKSKSISGLTTGRIFPLPLYTFWDLSVSSSDNVAFYKAVIKNVCANYPAVEYGLWMGVTWPAGKDIVLLSIYDTSTVNSSKEPQYATLVRFPHSSTGATMIQCGYDNYVWYTKTNS